MPIIRLYRPIEEDLQAIKFEQGEKKSIILPHDLEENIQRFYTKYLAILRDENHAVIELGMGNIGKATLFLSEQTKPFVRKTFHDTNCYSFKHENIIVGKTFDGTNYYIHQHQNLSVASMNFMIDLRIMRAVQGLPIMPQLQACSYLQKTFVTEFKEGRMVTQPLDIAEIPDQHVRTFIDGMIEMHTRGVTIDNNPTNVLYDNHSGFVVIDALPSSRLIPDNLHAETDEAMRQIHYEDFIESGDFYQVRRTTYDISPAEQVFESAKFIALALLDQLPYGAQHSISDVNFHRLDIQKVFLPCLYRVVGETKQRYEHIFSDLRSRVSSYLDTLYMNCTIGSGWNAGNVFYNPAPKGSAIADDPIIAEKIEVIKTLLI